MHWAAGFGIVRATGHFGNRAFQFRPLRHDSPLPPATLNTVQGDTMSFSMPVQLVLDGQPCTAIMGPFEHSTERQFSLAVQRKALEDCSSKEELRKVALHLLEGWAASTTALQGLMLENIELRQAIAMQHSSLKAADEMLTEAGQALQRYEKQSAGAKRRLWPWKH